MRMIIYELAMVLSQHEKCSTFSAVEKKIFSFVPFFDQSHFRWLSRVSSRWPLPDIDISHIVKIRLRLYFSFVRSFIDWITKEWVEKNQKISKNIEWAIDWFKWLVLSEEFLLFFFRRRFVDGSFQVRLCVVLHRQSTINFRMYSCIDEAAHQKDYHSIYHRFRIFPFPLRKLKTDHFRTKKTHDHLKWWLIVS